MLPAFASLEELAARVPGGVGDTDEERAQAALDDASTLIRAETNRSWTTTAGDELDLPSGDDTWRADILVKVCLAAALRGLVNPEGFTAQTIGSYSEARANASADVYLTGKERSLCRKAAGLSGLWTQSTTRSDLAGGRPGGLEIPGGAGRADRDVDIGSLVDVTGGEAVPWLPAE